jgi:hypothetical protein
MIKLWPSLKLSSCAIDFESQSSQHHAYRRTWAYAGTVATLFPQFVYIYHKGNVQFKFVRVKGIEIQTAWLHRSLLA